MYAGRYRWEIILSECCIKCGDQLEVYTDCLYEEQFYDGDDVRGCYKCVWSLRS